MSLRRSPTLTPAALAARRANALKSTGPRTARGKARSSLNDLRHGWDARNLRDKIERTGDKEDLILFDWIFTRFFELSRMGSERVWRYHMRLAARIWCHLTGKILLPRVRKSERKGWAVLGGVYRYGGGLICPRKIEVLGSEGSCMKYTNAVPWRRRQKRFAWIPQVEFISPPPRLPRAKRVRERAKQGAEQPQALSTVKSGCAAELLRRIQLEMAARPEGSQNVVGSKLESPNTSASCPVDNSNGGIPAGQPSESPAPRVPVGDLSELLERISLEMAARPEGSQNVVGSKLESRARSATCPIGNSDDEEDDGPPKDLDALLRWALDDTGDDAGDDTGEEEEWERSDEPADRQDLTAARGGGWLYRLANCLAAPRELLRAVSWRRKLRHGTPR